MSISISIGSFTDTLSKEGVARLCHSCTWKEKDFQQVHLEPSGQRFSQCFNLQVADDEIYLVVNAGCREKDLNHISKHLDQFKVPLHPPSG